MKVAVYKIENTVNGKLYFGQSARPQERWVEHKNPKNSRKSPKLAAAIAKYGVDKFSFSLLYWCENKKDANELEMFLIAECDSRNLGYNICVGGEGLSAGVNNPNYGRKQSAEHRAKIQEARKNFSLSPEARQRISATLKGRKLSSETIEKMVASRKGVKRAPFSEEHRANISKGRKGKGVAALSIEHRAKIAMAKQGVKTGPLSAEAKANMATAQRLRRQKERELAKHTSVEVNSDG